MITEHPIGTVSNINDPSKAGRIKVELAEMDGQEYPEWIDPIFPAGWITMPEVGDMVELVLPEGEDKIEFAGDVKYRGKLLNDANQVPNEFKVNYPQRRGYRTKAGHLIIFDDKAGSITIVNGKSTDTIMMDKAGLVKISAKTTELSKGPLEPVIKATAYNSQESTLLAAINSYIVLVGAAMQALGADVGFIGGLPPLPATVAALTAAGAAPAALVTAAVSTFNGASITWTSTKVKTG